MFEVELDEETHSFQVKDSEMIIAEGSFGVDRQERSVLILFTKIKSCRTIMINSTNFFRRLMFTWVNRTIPECLHAFLCLTVNE
jgi:hypothetical protein